jgi:hypothetical protein
MYKIQALRQQDMLPNLEPLFIVSIRGASKTMERFTKEYATDGVIASLTPSRQRRGRCTLVNDENEGALARTTQMKRMYPNMPDAHCNALFMAQTNAVEKFEAEVLEKSPLHHDIDKYIREQARAEDGKGHDAADRREHLRAWDATIEDNRLRAQKSQEAKDEKALKISKISLLNIHSTTYEDLNKLPVTALDEQIDKIRAVGTKYISAKASFKGTTDGKKHRERKIDAIVSEFKLIKELSELHEGKIAEDEPLKPHEEDAEPDDIEMVYLDEIQ